MKAVALAAVTACLLSAAGCGKAEFVEYVATEDGFKVLLPGTPKVQTESAAGMQIRVHSVGNKDGGYVVSSLALPPDLQNVDPAETEERLDAGVAGAIGKLEGQLTKSTKITLAGKHAGREVEFDIPKMSGIGKARFFYTSKRYVQAVVIGTPEFVNTPDTNQFLDSLQLLE